MGRSILLLKKLVLADCYRYIEVASFCPALGLISISIDVCFVVVVTDVDTRRQTHLPSGNSEDYTVKCQQPQRNGHMEYINISRTFQARHCHHEMLLCDLDRLLPSVLYYNSSQGIQERNRNRVLGAWSDEQNRKKRLSIQSKESLQKMEPILCSDE